MAVRLILNADDFGLTRGINRAIGELHAAGALTSATLMATGAAFDDAVAVARAHPGLGVGCHIVLVDGKPVSPPHTIPTLLSPAGEPYSPSFRASPAAFFLAVLRGAVSEAEIQTEAFAQIRRLQASGIVVTHIDTHKHTHLLPSVARPLLRAAVRAGVPAIRNPFEPTWALALGAGSIVRTLQLRILQSLRGRFLALPEIRDGEVRATDGTLGISATGNLNAATLSSLLAAMPEGTWELCCHPGYNDSDLDTITTRLRSARDTERLALLTNFCAGSLHPSPSHLIHYADLDSSLFPFPSSPRAERAP